MTLWGDATKIFLFGKQRRFSNCALFFVFPQPNCDLSFVKRKLSVIAKRQDLAPGERTADTFLVVVVVDVPVPQWRTTGTSTNCLMGAYQVGTGVGSPKLAKRPKVHPS